MVETYNNKDNWGSDSEDEGQAVGIAPAAGDGFISYQGSSTGYVSQGLQAENIGLICYASCCRISSVSTTLTKKLRTEISRTSFMTTTDSPCQKMRMRVEGRLCSHQLA